MFKAYLSEAASLLTEAVFGAPVKAQAERCWNTGYDCPSACGTCGAGKMREGDKYQCDTGRVYCKLANDCTYC